MHILKPCAAGNLYAPPLIHPSPLEGYFQGYGVGVYNIWPRKQVWTQSLQTLANITYETIEHLWLILKALLSSHLALWNFPLQIGALRNAQTTDNLGGSDKTTPLASRNKEGS